MYLLIIDEFNRFDVQYTYTTWLCFNRHFYRFPLMFFPYFKGEFRKLSMIRQPVFIFLVTSSSIAT